MISLYKLFALAACTTGWLLPLCCRGDDAPNSDFSAKAALAFENVQKRVRDDPILKPLTAGKLKKYTSGDEKAVDLDVDTPEAWDDFPIKGGNGKARRNGRIMFFAVQDKKSDRGYTPFVPPKGCWYGHTMLRVPGKPGVELMVDSVTSDSAAHRRLLKITIDEFSSLGIKLETDRKDSLDSTGGPQTLKE